MRYESGIKAVFRYKTKRNKRPENFVHFVDRKQRNKLKECSGTKTQGNRRQENCPFIDKKQRKKLKGSRDTKTSTCIQLANECLLTSDQQIISTIW